MLFRSCAYFMNKKVKETLINIGSGKDFTIKQYAQLMLNILIPKNKIKIVFDLSKPNGTPRKVLDISLAKKYGWKPKIKLKKAILKTYYNYIKQKNK